MRTSRTAGILALFIAVGVVLGSAPADAAWTLVWTTQMQQQNDKVFVVGAIDHQSAVFFGSESGGQGDQPFELRTTNGGGSFQKTPVDMTDIFNFTMPVGYDFAGPSAGYRIALVGISGIKIQKSTDGGLQWAPVNVSGLPGDPNGVFALDATHAYVPTTGGGIASTTNGMAWSAASVPNASDVDFTGAYFLESRLGWLVGGKYEEEEVDVGGGQTEIRTTILDKGTVARTVDGGTTWEVIYSGDSIVWSSVAFTSPNQGIMAGWDNNDGFLRITNDGGYTWTPANLPPGPGGQDYWTFTKVKCPDPAHCWVVGSAGNKDGGPMNKVVFLFSGDAGATWELQQPDEGFGTVFAADFYDAHLGWACGDMGQVWKWDDGNVQPLPDGGGDTASGPVGPWADVFGTFTDAGVPPYGQVDAGSTGTAETIGPGYDGSMVIGDGHTGGAELVCTTSGGGCSASPSTTTPAPWALLVLLALGALAWRRLRLGIATLVLAGGIVFAGCESDGETTCVDPNATDTVAGVDANVPTDLGGVADIVQPAGPFCLNTDGAAPAAIPGNGAGATTRNAAGDGRIAVARVTEEGGSDLWLLNPSTGELTQLTFFEDPSVHVWDPVWSPDRTQILFASDFRQDHNVMESNLFVIGADATGCRQVTPAPEAGVVADTGAATGTVTGAVKQKYGASGLLMPVPDMVVASTRATETTTTNAEGAFSLTVPVGNGTLVARLDDGSSLWETTADYDVAAGATAELGDIQVVDEPEWVTLRDPSWRPDGTSVIFFTDVTLYTAMGASPRRRQEVVGHAGDGMTTLLSGAGGDFGPAIFDPHADELLRGVDRGWLAFVAPDDLETALVEIPIPHADPLARAAMSPHRFLAVVVPLEGAREVFLAGSDDRGRLVVQQLTTFGDEALLLDGVDWSPAGDELIVLRSDGAGGQDLYTVDAVTGSATPLLDDGRCRGASWYGR